MKRAALIVLGVVVAGCAPQFDIGGGAWKKSGAQIQQVTLDEMECARFASRAYETPETYVGGLADTVRVYVEDGQMVHAFGRCMEGKGYRPS
jgi:hypothetical protein